MPFRLPQPLRRSFRSPLFAAMVAVLVAIVVAVNATAFTAIHALRWKALPYADGEALVELRADLVKFGFEVGLTERLREHLAEDTPHFAGALGYRVAQQLRADGDGQRWRIARATPDLAGVLGVQPALGRLFGAESLTAGADAVLVLSDAAWRARFGADPAVIGRQVRFEDRPYTVIGVMPAGFVFPDASVDAWRPYLMSAEERAQSDGGNVGDLDVVARLAPGIGVAQAAERLQAIFAADPSVAGLLQNAGMRADARAWRERFAAGHWRALALLQLAALLLMAVVVANLVNLNLDRLLGRAREFDIRRAIGADERAIVGGIVADLAPPVLLGLAAGLVLTPVGLALARRYEMLPDALPQGAGFGIAALVAGGVVAAAALGSGLVAAAVSRTAARLSTRAAIGGLGRVRPAMIVAQVMLTTILLGGAGLLLRSAIHLMQVDRGFDAAGVLLTVVDPAGVSISGRRYDPATDEARYKPLVETLRAEVAGLPGVRRVAIASAPPFSQWETVSGFRTGGQPDPVQARARQVGPGYFETLGIGLVAGRSFEAADLGEASPIVVDQLWVDRYLRAVDPLGATVEVPLDAQGTTRPARVIGVARTVKHERLDEEDNLPTVYQIAEAPLPVFWLVTRTDGDVGALAETVRQRVRAIAPSADIGVNRPLAALVGETLAAQRSLLAALGTFAVLTLLLAALGLAAVLSFAVRRRTAELGVRMALGASPSRVGRLVMGQGARLIALGALLGLAAGLPLARLLADRLHGLSFTDPLTWAAAALLVGAIAAVACYLPARRAAGTDPVVALRQE